MSGKNNQLEKQNAIPEKIKKKPSPPENFSLPTATLTTGSATS
ncbi:MAG: hypothetical protein ACYC54_09310 [Sedimentisphaerales bacterium]